eukprot:scaffold4301_cov115-Isochrysis_galbana.AAC.1
MSVGRPGLPGRRGAQGDRRAHRLLHGQRRHPPPNHARPWAQGDETSARPREGAPRVLHRQRGPALSDRGSDFSALSPSRPVRNENTANSSLNRAAPGFALHPSSSCWLCPAERLSLSLPARCTAAPTPRTSSSTSRASLRGRCSPRSWRRHRSSPSPEPDSGPVGRASSASPPSRRASPARKHASVSPRFSADQAGPWLVGLKAAARVKICIIDGTHPATPPLFAPPTGRSDLGPPLGARGRVPWIRLSSVL